jgi:very-short-patch-repair endonuclease
MLKKDKIIKEKYNNIHPTCLCGCNQQTRYEAKLKDFCKWIHGHQSRVKGHFGDPKSKKRVNAIVKTRKEKFASGEYDYIKKAIKNRDSVELGKKISKGSKGVPKPKPKGFGAGRKHSQSTKEKMRDIQNKKWESGDIGNKKYYTSKLENLFANILDLLDIKYSTKFYAKDIKAFYDFYIPEHNIIIEVDGDFWHCNPDSKHSEAKYESQKKNLVRDKEKEQWTINNGYKLLRFWENDINNNIKQVKQTLLENCK